MNQHSASSSPSDEAIEWLARLRATDVTDAERGDFAVWLATGTNKAEFDACLALWEHVEVLSTLEVAIPVKRRRWIPLAAAASLILGLLLTVVVQNLGDEFTTAVGEQRRVVLNDGSTLHLNTASTVTVRLDSDERSVKVERGEAYFEVSANPQRPFVVTTEHAKVTVVGTAFVVHAMGALTRVSVSDGLVTIQGASNHTVSLSPGDEALISTGGMRVADVDPDAIATWRSGHLEYRNATLAYIVADLNRYLPVQIKINDSALGNLRVTAVLRLADQEAMLEALSEVHPLRWKALSDNLILIQPAI